MHPRRVLPSRHWSRWGPGQESMALLTCTVRVLMSVRHVQGCAISSQILRCVSSWCSLFLWRKASRCGLFVCLFLVQALAKAWKRPPYPTCSQQPAGEEDVVSARGAKVRNYLRAPTGLFCLEVVENRCLYYLTDIVSRRCTVCMCTLCQE